MSQIQSCSFQQLTTNEAKIITNYLFIGSNYQNCEIYISVFARLKAEIEMEITMKNDNSFSYYAHRILWTRSFWLVFSAFFVIMQWDFFYQLRWGNVTSEAFASSFLAANSVGNAHLFQLMIIAILPVYLFLAVGKTHDEDIKSGQIVAVLSRMGRKKYYLYTYLSAAVFSFLLVFLSLLINLMIVKLTISVFPIETMKWFDFFRGQKEAVIKEPMMQFAVWQVKHGFLAFLLYAGSFSFLASLLSVFTINVSRIFRKSYQTLVIVCLIYIFFLPQFLGAEAFQPKLAVMFNVWLQHILLVLFVLFAINILFVWGLNRGEEELEV